MISKNARSWVVEGVEYRRDTREHWSNAELLRDAWIREGLRDVRIDVLTLEHARNEPGGGRCLVRGWRPTPTEGE